MRSFVVTGNIQEGLFTWLPNEASWVGIVWANQGGQMEEGHLIHVTAYNPGEYTVYKAPVPDKENMFWVWEVENWFLPIEDGKTAPYFAGPLLALVDAANLSKEENDAWDEKLLDGRLVMGYIDKDRRVSVHMPTKDDVDADEAVKTNVERTLGEFFGSGVDIRFL